MRWVDRGPEPAGVERYRLNFTLGWVRYSNNPGKSQPRDSYWRKFRQELRTAFLGKCGYCERICAETSESGSRAPTVDHFKPKSQFPKLTYEWSNWVFCCDRCNSRKADQWPSSGLVDPCAPCIPERLKLYFDYSARTGEIVPKGGLAEPDRIKAQNTISSLGLNNRDLRKSRQRWIARFQDALSQHDESQLLSVVDVFTDAAAEYCGITRMFLAQYQSPAR